MKGTGTVTLHLSQGQVLCLQDVLYVPDLKENLVSISAMEDKGLKVAFVDGNVHIWKKSFKKDITIGFRVDKFTRLEEFHWERCHVILSDRLNYGTGGLDTFITKPFPKQGRW